MKTLIASLAVAASCILSFGSSQAQAETNGIYIAPKFALNVQHASADWSGNLEGSGSKTDTKAGGALAVGYDFSSKLNVPVRLELEYGAYGKSSKSVYNEPLTTKTSVSFQTLLVNAYYDFKNSTDFTPYVGAGIGLASLKTEGSATLDNGWVFSGTNITGAKACKREAVFAGQVGFGCSYAFNENVSVDLGYRFLMIGDGKVSAFDTTVKSKNLYAHQFMLGARVTF